MKRVLSFLLIGTLLLQLTGCCRQSVETVPETQPAPIQTEPVPSETGTEPTRPAYTPEVVPPTVWVAECKEYITLWKALDSDEALARIPVGDSMELLGWEETFAHVRYGQLEGYVRSDYMRPADDSFYDACLDTVELTNIYTYEQMLTDLQTLQDKYPEDVTLGSIGTSEQGRDIPVLLLGDPQAQQQVLIQGNMHAREHLNTWLLMAMADYWLSRGISRYGDVCWHIIPMVNPDGVAVSQSGKLSSRQQEIYRWDLDERYTRLEEAQYAAAWKANGLGVDLNRNFPSGWEPIDGPQQPSSQRYKGDEPFCAAESRALGEYTLAYDFDVTISYHSSGSVIYYEFGNRQPANAMSESLSKAVAAVTGYEMKGSDTVEGGGYKDWAIDALGVPSLTIEVGCGDSPLVMREVYSIFVRNLQVLPAIAQWLQS